MEAVPIEDSTWQLAAFSSQGQAVKLDCVAIYCVDPTKIEAPVPANT